MAEGGIKVLVVEDDNFLKDMLGQRLTQESFQVVYAHDGDEAFEKAKQEKPDIVLLDLLLPGSSGFDVLKQIRATEGIKDTPIVILSNLGSEEDIQKGKELGANDFLIKSNFNLEEIVAKVREMVGGGSASSETAAPAA